MLTPGSPLSIFITFFKSPIESFLSPTLCFVLFTGHISESVAFAVLS